jgi:membrane protein DedA with SNARE-associated domain/rhodanese-related sulfurtransferase
MDLLLHIVEQYGLAVVFLCVLLDQGGLPVPAYPAIIVTAALATTAGEPWWPILIVATVAAVLADLLWFAGGRRFGASLLRLMCKLSLSPDSCVGLTRRIYAKWGAPSLVLSKYVPGFAAVATTLAGETGTQLRRFVLYDGIGAALWAAGAVALGVIFHEAVEAVLLELELLGHVAIYLLLAAIALFIGYKWVQRRRFLMKIRMARISSQELEQLIRAEMKPRILDVRTLERRERSGWIPGSIHVIDPAAIELEPELEVVVYCDCPNDASAALVAKKLQERGFMNVRPLTGGLDAWRELGFPVVNS